jgi:hypothetical protein
MRGNADNGRSTQRITDGRMILYNKTCVLIHSDVGFDIAFFGTVALILGSE